MNILLEEYLKCIWSYLIYVTVLHLCTGTIIEGPSDVIYFPGQTPLPIELICNVTSGVPAWRVNGTAYLLTDLTSGVLAGHNRTGANILVNSPKNSTEYICILPTLNAETRSDPAYIFVAGELYYCMYTYMYMYTCLCIVLLPQTQNLYLYLVSFCNLHSTINSVLIC